MSLSVDVCLLLECTSSGSDEDLAPRAVADMQQRVHWNIKFSTPVFGADVEGRFVRAGFRQNGFFADFYFWAAGFFRGFSRRIFSPHFCGKKCPEKSSRKIPGKILQNLYNKNPPTHFCRLPRARFEFRRRGASTQCFQAKKLITAKTVTATSLSCAV